MVEYFCLMAVVSLFCLGLRSITDDGMIGYPIRSFFKENYPTLGKPVVLCSTCMSSIWGTVIFWGYTLSRSSDVLWQSFFLWIGIAVSAAFLNSLLWSVYERLK